jgi:predicted RNA-binding Zn-ribbon protein involved in translation (DUF1610 family)
MTDRYPTPPKNLMEFAHCFATDERCAEYLFELRHPDGYVCPKCGSWRMAYCRQPVRQARIPRFPYLSSMLPSVPSSITPGIERECE